MRIPRSQPQSIRNKFKYGASALEAFLGSSWSPLGSPPELSNSPIRGTSAKAPRELSRGIQGCTWASAKKYQLLVLLGASWCHLGIITRLSIGPQPEPREGPARTPRCLQGDRKEATGGPATQLDLLRVLWEPRYGSSSPRLPPI